MTNMHGMCCVAAHQPLLSIELPVPIPAAGQVLVKVRACGVCRTDLHVVDGELSDIPYPVIPGHEIVGEVAAIGDACAGFAIGQRVGIPWLGFSCGQCAYCVAGQENLCDAARFHGYTLPGGYAEYVVADARYCFTLPAQYTDQEAAPLLCAGLIGFRALRMAGTARRLGIYGFGAAAHILAQIALREGREVYAFTRPGDVAAQQFAMALGVAWAGDSSSAPPAAMDAAIIFAPVGSLVPAALAHIVKGGVVVCAGIHMSDIPAFPYRLLWGERKVCSVANLTREDGLAFFRVADQFKLQVTTRDYPLAQANEALADLRDGKISGAAVLVMPKS